MTDGKIEEYGRLAQEGDAEALYDLADCYFFGDGVDQDRRKAIELYREAADAGEARGLFRLAE